MRYLIIVLCLFAANSWADVVHGTYPGTNGKNALKVNSAGQIELTLISGEDETNDVLRTEQQFSYCAGTAVDAQCGAPATFLHTVTCNSDAAATAGTLEIRDATAAGAGTVIQLLTFGTTYIGPVTLTFDVILTTGLYLDFTTTADVTCSASYR